MVITQAKNFEQCLACSKVSSIECRKFRVLGQDLVNCANLTKINVFPMLMWCRHLSTLLEVWVIGLECSVLFEGIYYMLLRLKVLVTVCRPSGETGHCVDRNITMMGYTNNTVPGKCGYLEFFSEG
ncbi:hypothetical protein DFH07DRAFT_767409 [Mycena maculata]|uniref:Uncharacterized protein n=1 Tax=Mycena maculata TaxID=230809 RepID=A0AAD7JXW5_9AGAR|nr:hypothetical protein DFH07DRAFT_767409 [Mycena maculata]